jgi:hypothetical protein
MYCIAVAMTIRLERHRDEIGIVEARCGRRGTESLQTLRWREKDSNPRSPVRETFFSNPLIKWQRAAQNELCDRRNDQVLDAAKFKQGDGANEAGFGGIAPKNYWK